MKKILFALLLGACPAVYGQISGLDDKFARPLSDVLGEIQGRFGVTLKIEVDTAGKTLPYADFRVLPYSVEESLAGVLAPFDYKFVKQGANSYKIKNYEYTRRTEADGEKSIAYLNSLYSDTQSWEARKKALRSDVRRITLIDTALGMRVAAAPKLSKVRKFDGYTVQNFAIETLPGLYVCGSIYAPASGKGPFPLILAPNGHFQDGRYREDQQLRMATLARMGAICVDYDLFGWGESALQVGEAAHRRSVAQTVQMLGGITILDYMLTREDVDPARIGVHGGSGGGTQSLLLTAVDDRFSALGLVVNLASHFDGGCPCESGMAHTLAAGGTNNAELAAMFAPKPMLVVSDGGDWTSSVPQLEYPYLSRIYGFYGKKDNVSNVHLPAEGHDFGPNKRNAVYDFFAATFGLDKRNLDESKVRIEPTQDLLSFGNGGELLPQGAVRSIDEVEAMFDKNVRARLNSDMSLQKKSSDWAASLNLADPAKQKAVQELIETHLRTVRDWHNAHPYTLAPEGMNPITGLKLTKLDRQMIVCSQLPEVHHKTLLEGLNALLTPEQVEAVLDKYTVGKVAFTLNGYKSIVPDLTAAEEAHIVGLLKQAREQAIDYKNMEQISAIFEIYKTKIELYLYQNDRNWKKIYKEFTDKIRREKEAQKKAN